MKRYEGREALIDWAVMLGIFIVLVAAVLNI
jgi:hypothetical protein